MGEDNFFINANLTPKEDSLMTFLRNRHGLTVPISDKELGHATTGSYRRLAIGGPHVFLNPGFLPGHEITNHWRELTGEDPNRNSNQLTYTTLNTGNAPHTLTHELSHLFQDLLADGRRKINYNSELQADTIASELGAYYSGEEPTDRVQDALIKGRLKYNLFKEILPPRFHIAQPHSTLTKKQKLDN